MPYDIDTLRPLVAPESPSVLPSPASTTGGWLDAAVARLAEPRLAAGFARWASGRLTVTWADGQTASFGAEDAVPHVRLRVHHPSLYRKLLLGGDLGAGESYMDGD